MGPGIMVDKNMPAVMNGLTAVGFVTKIIITRYDYNMAMCGYTVTDDLDRIVCRRKGGSWMKVHSSESQLRQP